MHRKTLRTLTLLALFCLTAAPYAAIIKVGDVLDIQVVGRAEFSGRFVVHENGTIDHPLLADAPITNISTSELMNDLTLRLARHIDNPLVLVSIVAKPDIMVTVLGQVARPGPVKTYQGASVQEIIHDAGGPVVETADLEHLNIIHKNRQPAAETYNLKSFLADGDIEKMPPIDAGDIIVVPSLQKTKKVKVIGAVQKPGLFTLEEKTSVFEMIYLAGGPAEKADLSRVRRVSQVNGKSMEEILDIQGYVDRGKIDNIPAVAEGDVIIVYTKWFDARSLLSLLNNTLLIIVTIQAFTGVFK
jgi:protein involved in polysaccharide export with SLBB domain